MTKAPVRRSSWVTPTTPCTWPRPAAARAGSRQRVHTETALARALERDELVVFYQPIVETASRRWVGVEALLRWQHPTRGLLAPAAFLDVAEQTGLIVPMGE